MASRRWDGPGDDHRTAPQEALVGPTAQSRGDLAVASRARAPQVGRLRQAPTPSAAGDGPRGRRPDPQIGPREPEVGVPPDPGRVTEAGMPVFTRDCPQGDAVASGAARAQEVNANVGGVVRQHAAHLLATAFDGVFTAEGDSRVRSGSVMRVDQPWLTGQVVNRCGDDLRCRPPAFLPTSQAGGCAANRVIDPIDRHWSRLTTA
jgi:hypothetical protein